MSEDKDVNSPVIPGAEGTATGKSTGTNASVPGDGAIDGSDLNDRYQKSQEQVQKLENDIRALKSTFDRKANEEKIAWRKKEEEYQKQLRDIQYKMLPEDQRPTFERQVLNDDMDKLRQERDQYKALLEQQDQIKNYVKFFSDQGIDESKLDQSSPEAVVNTGWEEMAKELKRLREQQNSSNSVALTPELQPPDVHVASKSSPSIKPTWHDLEKEYGSRENVYRKIELGQLPPNILPD